MTHCRVVRAWLDHLDGAPGILPPLDRLVLWCRPLDDAAARRLPYGHHTATVKIGSRAHEALDEMDAPQLVGRLVDVALDGHRVKWIGLPRPPAAVSTPAPSRST